MLMFLFSPMYIDKWRKSIKSGVIYYADRGEPAKSAKFRTRKIFMLHGIRVYTPTMTSLKHLKRDLAKSDRVPVD